MAELRIGPVQFDISHDPKKLTDALAAALLSQIPRLREHAPDGGRKGTYTMTGTLREDGTWHWAWEWWPPTRDQGGSAGAVAFDG